MNRLLLAVFVVPEIVARLAERFPVRHIKAQVGVARERLAVMGVDPHTPRPATLACVIVTTVDRVAPGVISARTAGTKVGSTHRQSLASPRTIAASPALQLVRAYGERCSAIRACSRLGLDLAGDGTPPGTVGASVGEIAVSRQEVAPAMRPGDRTLVAGSLSIAGARTIAPPSFVRLDRLAPAPHTSESLRGLLGAGCQRTRHRVIARCRAERFAFNQRRGTLEFFAAIRAGALHLWGILAGHDLNLLQRFGECRATGCLRQRRGFIMPILPAIAPKIHSAGVV